MSSFTDPLRVEPNDDCSSWTILEPFRFWLEALHVGDVITVPRGTTTDFASVPKLFWSILSPFGRYGKAAVVHDHLYRNGGTVDVSDQQVDPVARIRTFTRAECDQVFLDAMECLGVNWITRKFMYRMVRMFGMWSYKGK